MSREWSQDLPAEAVMTKLGLKWEVKDWPIANIDIDASWHNQARIQAAKDSEYIERYGLAFERGDVFPMIVLMLTPTHQKKAIIAGGNHRVGGCDLAGVKTARSYIVTTDDQYIIDQLPRVLNHAIGKPIPPSELMSQAVDCCYRHNRKLKEVAELYGVREGTLSTKLRVRKIADQIGAMSIKTERIPDSTLTKLNTLADNDNVLKETTKLIVDAKCTTDQAADLIDRTKECRTEASRLAFLEDQRKLLAPENSPAYEQPPQRNKQSGHQRFLAWLTSGENLLKQRNTLEKNQVTKHDERIEVCRRLNELAKLLSKMASAGIPRDKKRAG